MNDSVIIGFLFYLYRFYLYFHKMNSKFRGSKKKSEAKKYQNIWMSMLRNKVEFNGTVAHAPPVFKCREINKK